MPDRITNLILNGLMGASRTAGRWTTTDAKCCPHVSHSHKQDTKGRGGWIFDSGDVGYNCFNCGYKTKYQVGKYFPRKMESLLEWNGFDKMDILRMKQIAMELAESGDYEVDDSGNTFVSVNGFSKHELPKQAAPFSVWSQMKSPPRDFLTVLMAVHNRNPHLLDHCEFWWTPETDHYLNKKYIIPFYGNGEIIGYTARDININTRYRFYNQYDDSILFNYDELNNRNRNYILVHEAPMDAMLTNGVATCGTTIKHNHVQMLNKCGKQIIVVPDRDKNGNQFIQQALNNNWWVSFPEWGEIKEDNKTRLIKDLEEDSRVNGVPYACVNVYKHLAKTELDIRTKRPHWMRGSL